MIEDAFITIGLVLSKYNSFVYLDRGQLETTSAKLVELSIRDIAIFVTQFLISALSDDFIASGIYSL